MNPIDHPHVVAFDGAADRCLDAMRKHPKVSPFADRLFYAASESANHSVIWHVLAWSRAIARRNFKEAFEISLALGVESGLVNGFIKNLFRRERPLHEALRPHRLRTPRTSSFPSGHATSAFFAARLLSHTSPRLRPVFYLIAMIVASSRSYVRIHHASDVVAGALIGDAMARAVTRVMPTTTSPHTHTHPHPHND